MEHEADKRCSVYSQRMVDRRNALDIHLGIAEESYLLMQNARHRALLDHVGEALDSANCAAAQVYALLLVAEKQQTETIGVNLRNPEELANSIAAGLESDLHRIADACG
jgi:hypothetical protein